jgi:hypothetical protein
MIVVPIVIVLILFGRAIAEFFRDAWDNLQDNAEYENPDGAFTPIPATPRPDDPGGVASGLIPR